MKTVFIACFVVLLQACATPVHEAPAAPCASTRFDCGPARPVNQMVASGESVQRVFQHG